MEKFQLYRTALDCIIFIRNFMFSENHYFRNLDDALQPLIVAIQASMSDMIPKPKSEGEKDSE